MLHDILNCKPHRLCFDEDDMRFGNSLIIPRLNTQVTEAKRGL